MSTHDGRKAEGGGVREDIAMTLEEAIGLIDGQDGRLSAARGALLDEITRLHGIEKAARRFVHDWDGGYLIPTALRAALTGSNEETP